MHIFYDHQIFSLQNVGGISRYFVELATRLPLYSDGIQTTVIAPLHINQLLASSTVDTFGRKIPEFPGKHLLLPHFNNLITQRVLRKRTPDIFHETYYSKNFQKGSSPHVLTVYDMIHERFPEEFSGPDRYVAKQKAAAVSRADHIIAISQNTCADLIACLGVPEEKITVIPLASSFETLPLSGTCNYRKWNRPYLLYVGLRQGVKNFSRLLNAYKNSEVLRSNYDLLCVGGGMFSRQEVRTISEAGLQKMIHHLQADDQALKMFYSDAEVFVYPSLYEGFGLPLLEAMRCGCPVVCSNTSSMPEIAGDAAHYFDPENEEELRLILEQTVQSETDRDLLKKRGFDREKAFSWEKCVKKTESVYRSLQ